MSRVRNLEATVGLVLDTRIKFALVEATLRLQHSRPAEALTRIREARALADQSSTFRKTPVLNQLSYLLTMEGKLEESMAVAQEAVAHVEAEYGSNHPRTALSLFRVAEVQSFLGREPEEQVTLDRVIGIFRNATGVRRDFLARALQRRAQSRRILGRNAEALADMQEASALLEETGTSSQRGGAHEAIARIEKNLGRFEEALAATDRALSLLEGQEMHELALRAGTEVLRAQLLAELGRPDEALVQLQASVTAVDETHPWSSVGHMGETGEIADAWASLSRWDDAQRTLGRYLDREGDYDPLSIGRLQLTRARIYIGAGDFAAAMRWANEGRATLVAADAGPTDIDEADAVLAAAESE